MIPLISNLESHLILLKSQIKPKQKKKYIEVHYQKMQGVLDCEIGARYVKNFSFEN